MSVTTGWAAAFPFIAAAIMIVVGWVGGLNVDRRFADLNMSHETRDLVAQSSDALAAVVSIPPLAWGVLLSLKLDPILAFILAIVAFAVGIVIFLAVPLIDPAKYHRVRCKGLGIANLILLLANVALAFLAYF